MADASGGSILGKMIQAGCAVLITGPAAAETVSCMMDDGDEVAFMIDRNQFTHPLDPDEPPQRKVTTVRYGAKHFPAEPILMGDIRGFQAEGLGGTTMLFIMQSDGTAILANNHEGLRIGGHCEVMQ
ncbi:hypothetical protein [Cognatiyoonia koreensis]|nr:hypothetical protein [Cognatiyoonia koreensis]